MKGKYMLLSSLALIVLAFTACSVQQSPPAAVENVTEEKQPVQAFGVVKALDTRDISADFPVKIVKLLVQEGQNISGGETLAVIDTNEATEEIRKLEDQNAALKSETALTQKMLVQRKELFSNNLNPDVIKLENSLKRAQAEYDGLLAVDAEQLALLEAGALSQQEYQEYAEKVAAGKFACENAELTLQSYKASLQDEFLRTETEINQNLRKIAEMDQELQKLRHKLSSDYFKDNGIVSAITDGIVCSVDCIPGETVPAGRKMFGIMDTASIVIEANVDEQFIKDVRLGARAYIVPEYDRNQEYKGKVTFIAACAVQQNSETVIPVQITPDEQYEGLHPGYNMEISIEAD